MAQAQSRLLALPRELRDEIYKAYLQTDGYTYDFGKNKLRTADGHPIDFALMYTCRQVGYEMRGLALRLNTVCFSTLYGDELRKRAGRWDWVSKRAFQREAVEAAIHHLTDEAFDVAVQAVNHNIFAAVAQELRPRLLAGGGIYQHFTYGDIPSVYQAAERRFLQLALADAHMKRYFESESYLGDHRYRVDGHVYHLLQLASDDQPWRIPTEDELDAHAAQVPSKHGLDSKQCDVRRYKSFWDAYQGKPRFSAAAAAIYFLNSLPPTTRTHLRKIVLHEDRMAVCGPASHVRGLVPFCHENPALRIERRVDLWWNCFISAMPHSGKFLDDPTRWLGMSTHFLAGRMEHESVSAKNIPRVVAEWVMEAWQPIIPQAISLTLDGSPDPALMGRIFQEAVQQAAAWQTARVRVFASKPGGLLEGREAAPFMYEGFPELLQILSDKPTNSRVRCNFDPGRPLDDEQVNEIVNANQDLDGWDFMQAWHYPQVWFRPPPPLPDFHSMKEEYVFPKAWHERDWEDSDSECHVPARTGHNPLLKRGYGGLASVVRV